MGRLLAILWLTFALGLLPSAARAQQSDENSAQDPPAGVGEEGVKPTRHFLPALLHNLGDDVKHLPRRNSVYWLAGGTALALAVHPFDDTINAHLLNRRSDDLWRPGHVLGSTPFVLGSAGAAYLIGRFNGFPRLRHLGMDEIESALLAEALTQGIKIAVRRERPPQGDQQSRTYSFPSGHAMMTFAAATVLQQHLGYRAAIPTYLVASYVAVSRLHDNRHYASDVAFGAALGVIVGRSVTFHGRNVYTYVTPMLRPEGGGVQVALLY